ncbi:extracellular solute-binding protein [Dactylosporangium roseum]|uniref:Extracellular solute-binding protein n=1 Tax=Dactylosporangium roseum TaxID=47989 RepID=A0ABY5YWU0_9ACTN|nr:extracellular solute-binding protein [Dactylosporangium roseum]UWZ34221.1 extracellular solute-binding protein [Dactylosporangium roseum]
MRRKLAATVAVAVLLSVAACSSDSPSETDGIKLVVFGPNQFNTIPANATKDVYTKVQNALAEGFIAENPQVSKIVFDARGQMADEVTRTSNAQLAGEQMDVIVCAGNPVNTSYQPKGMLEPLDDMVPQVKDRLAEGALTPFTVNGKVWAVPLSGVAVTTFFYNKTLFDKLKLTPPQTYEDFVAMAPALSGAGVRPVVGPGDVVVSSGVVRDDGMTRAYITPAFPAAPSYDVVAALVQAAHDTGANLHVGVTRSSDSDTVGTGRPSVGGYLQPRHTEIIDYYVRAGVLSNDREASAVVTLSNLFGRRSGVVQGVTDNYTVGKVLDAGAGMDAAARVLVEGLRTLACFDRERAAHGVRHWVPRPHSDPPTTDKGI